LSHREEAENSLLHSGAARGGKEDAGQFSLGSEQDGPGNYLADDRTHVPTHELETHDDYDRFAALNLADYGFDGFVESAFLLGCGKTLFVFGEVQGVQRA